ncbi:MAG TPA: extracellular solute-binding protein [Streptosporangiaceae bacterium]
MNPAAPRPDQPAQIAPGQVTRAHDGTSRRAFLGGAGRLAGLAGLTGTGLAAGGLGSLLAGCGGTSAAAVPPMLKLPDPQHPVLWPVTPDNQAIPSGQPPEHNGTLRVLSWPGRVSQRCVSDFAKAFQCAVEVSTFTTITQGISLLARGHGQYDLLAGAPTDVLGTLITRSLVQPVNHSYIPYIRQAWPVFTDPWYDSHWQYTVPFGIYTTGIAWRRDKIDIDPYTLRNAWQFPWIAKAAGRTGVLDDYRQSLGLALMTSDPRDIDTADPYLVNLARRRLLNLSRLTGGLRIDNNAAKQLATTQSWVHLAWSGQAVAAARALPPGVPIEVIGYWFPPTGIGPVTTDTFTVARGARNPVLAHLFCNFMLAHRNAMQNIAATGFMQPLTYAAPHRLIDLGILPASLTSAAVSSTYFDHGLKMTELEPSADELWQQAWTDITRQSRKR